MITHAHDLSPDFVAMLDLVLEADAVIDGLAELVSATLSGSSYENRVESLAATVLALEQRAAQIDEEAGRLNKISKAVGAHMRTLRTHLATTMRAEGVKTVRGRELTITVRETQPSLELLVEEDKVPGEYTRTRVEVDRNAIRAALVAGFVLDWAKLKTGDAVSIR